MASGYVVHVYLDAATLEGAYDLARALEAVQPGYVNVDVDSVEPLA